MGRLAGQKDFPGHRDRANTCGSSPGAHTLLPQPVWVGRYGGGTRETEAGVWCQNVQVQDGANDTDPVPFSLSCVSLFLSPHSQLSLLPCSHATGSEILNSWFLWKGTPLNQSMTCAALLGLYIWGLDLRLVHFGTQTSHLAF